MFRQLLFALAAMALCAGPASAQESVVRLVVPLGAGNPFDTSARILAKAMSEVTGLNYIVENRPGAGGAIGAAEVARARPDGRTLLYTTGGHVTNGVLHKHLPFETVESFEPITLLTDTAGFVLIVRSESPFTSARELIAAAKRKPGAITYGSFGIGNTTHVVAALFVRGAGIDMLHVPYKNPLPDLLGGHVEALFMGESTIMPLLLDGKVRPLAISAPQRSPSLPDVPTFEELGIRGGEVPAWGGILAPAGTPAEVVDATYEAIRKAVQTPEYEANLKQNYSRLVLMPPEEFGKYLDEEYRRFQKELPSLGISME